MKKEWEKWNKHVTNDFINLFLVFITRICELQDTHHTSKTLQVDSHRYVRKSEVIMGR